MTKTIWYTADGMVVSVDAEDSSAVVHGAEKAKADTDKVGGITLRHKVTVSDGEVTDAEYIAPPEPTLEQERNSASLPRIDFMIALKQAGVYLKAADYAASLPRDHDWRIRWETAQTFHRTNPDLIAGSKELGLTDADLDKLFGIS